MISQIIKTVMDYPINHKIIVFILIYMFLYTYNLYYLEPKFFYIA